MGRRSRPGAGHWHVQLLGERFPGAGGADLHAAGVALWRLGEYDTAHHTNVATSEQVQVLFAAVPFCKGAAGCEPVISAKAAYRLLAELAQHSTGKVGMF